MKKKKLPLILPGIALFGCMLFASLTASAQKSVYDVIPGSGPKKTEGSLPDVVKNGGKNYPDREYRRSHRVRRGHLPPGQAKKIYGGSATDYAPGQVKKKHGHYHGGKHKHGHKKHH